MYFFALLAASFGHYGDHQANIVKTFLESFVTYSAWIVKKYGIAFTIVLIFNNSLKI